VLYRNFDHAEIQLSVDVGLRQSVVVVEHAIVKKKTKEILTDTDDKIETNGRDSENKASDKNNENSDRAKRKIQITE
jgi:hypothetical protein